MVRQLDGKVCLVTGASRGIGKGIALQLGQAGATVYITGRSLVKKDGVPGSLQETAEEVEKRGGTCIAVQCDHSKDADITALFARIKEEQDGRLDVLVNNAFSAANKILKSIGTPFWEEDDSLWDEVNIVSVRNGYKCTQEAARMMTKRNSGLIVNISSMGGLRYALGVAYGVNKAATDRMAADCAVELASHNVACVCLWPGPVKTEIVMDSLGRGTMPGKAADIFLSGETPEYAGKCVANMAADEQIMKKTGKILLSMDLGDEYQFEDIDGGRPVSMRAFQTLMKYAGFAGAANYIPQFFKMPRWCFSLAANKF